MIVRKYTYIYIIENLKMFFTQYLKIKWIKYDCIDISNFMNTISIIYTTRKTKFTNSIHISTTIYLINIIYNVFPEFKKKEKIEALKCMFK